jgi:hypothetical protein
MSIYNAQNILPAGSDILGLFEKQISSGEYGSVVVAGYGCEFNQNDPLSNQPKV